MRGFLHAHIPLHFILVLQQMLMSVNVETVHTTVLTLLVLLYALVEKGSTSPLMAGIVLVIMFFYLICMTGL